MERFFASARIARPLCHFFGLFCLAWLTLDNTALAAGSARQQNPACGYNACDEASAYAECSDELSLAKKDSGLQPWVQGLICYNGHGRNSYNIVHSDPLGLDAGLNDYQNGFAYVAGTAPLNPGSVLGVPRCREQCFGDPINAGVGNKFETHVEYRGEGVFPLSLALTYNSSRGISYYPEELKVFGRNRTHSYLRRINYFDTSSGPVVYVSRPGGEALRFTQSGSGWVPDVPGDGQLSMSVDGGGAIAGWQLRENKGDVEIFDAKGQLSEIQDVSGFRQVLAYDDAGRLASVRDAVGRAMRFEYGADGLVSGVWLPDGQQLRFYYTASKDLERVSYPDGHEVKYLYDEPDHISGYAPAGMYTGFIDEQQQRYSTTSYAKSLYGSDAKALETYLGDAVDRHMADYAFADGETYTTAAAITSSLGSVKTISFALVDGIVSPVSIVQSCDSCTPQDVSYEYAADGQVSSITRSGVITSYVYNARGLLDARVEASNDAAGKKRTTQTDWNPDFAAPLERRIYNAAGALTEKSTWTYNVRGQALTVSRTDPAAGTVRTSTTKYCEQADLDAGACPLLGLVTTVDGPRSDVMDRFAYTYYSADDSTCTSAPTICPHRRGDLWKVTNALGQVTEYLSYDGAGRVLSVKDANGTITDYSYHPRGWLTASKVRGADDTSESDDHITRIDYWPTGLVKQVTQPDGAFTAFTYDAAHRLTDIADNVGNTLHYTLDNAGNRVKEDTKDAAGTLKRTLSRVYNQLGQLATQATASGDPTDFGYDANGNTTAVTDALGHKTQNDYDPLNRLARTLQDVGGIAAETKFGYDALDNLTKVTDPKGLDTTYAYNGLGDLTKLTSPDTGVTTYTYDSAGNRATQTDARNIKTTYSYDALNRLTKVAYPTTSLNVSYTYDVSQTTCANGETYAVGRLARMQDSSGSTDYCYDRFGDLVRKVQTTNGKVFVLRYAYTKAGQLSRLTYPDGAAVDYVRNAQGQTTEVGVTPAGGPRQVLLGNATYYPFGPVASWSYGNGRPMQRVLDQDYRPLAVSDTRSDGLSTGFAFDPAGNLSALTAAGNTAPVVSLDYDALGRLTAFKDGPTGTVIDGYSYDATGNRLSAKVNTTTQSYTYPTTNHRLSAVAGTARTYDAIGNTLSIGGTAQEFAYDATGRMSQAKRAGTVVMKYGYNGRGEQVRRVDKTNTYTLYDESGHWLGNYDANGASLQQAIWLDDLPVGVLAKNSLRYVQPDHLGTPRAVIDPVRDVAIWKWDLKGEAFGNTPPDQDPDKDGTTFVFDMRFPGQRYDSATGFNQNYFRDYDPGTGRYGQSDPIGLEGGFSTYSYVEAAPFRYSDIFGLVKHTSGRWIDCGKGCRIRIDFTYDEKTGRKARHLHWECKGAEGECGEYGGESHGGTWDDAPKSIKECALRNGFSGQSVTNENYSPMVQSPEISAGAKAAIYVGGAVIIIFSALTGAGS
ncbi:RHS repeat-associated core domain-containing protein [Xanthomonas sp. SI]|uniref:RHS repeat-associated core domain-containing protein n=1 Tax=Xanthomonas sp. SI TaxID=2724123 RepID=UPI001639D80A|nr:RHS repeat-associated core domain-containing protein [Xanthomonas sp. SI]QNH11767.1 RHS repeat protein [Xanthomonas sp. SI]